MIFLVQELWPFLLLAFGVGLVTGWLSARPAREGEPDA